MKILLGVLVALIVVAALAVPLMLPHQSTTAHSSGAVMYVADEPTPTPTRVNGQGGCQGGGGC